MKAGWAAPAMRSGRPAKSPRMPAVTVRSSRRLRYRSCPPAVADRLTWGCKPTAPGWYACVVDYGRLPFPAARRWTGALWDDERGIRSFDGPYADTYAALNWAMEICPEGR